MIQVPEYLERYFDKVNQLGFEYSTFNPFSIAEQMGIEVRYVDFDTNPLGSATKIEGDFIILLDCSLADDNLRYFVLAHELCHVINHDSLGEYYMIQRYGKDKLEKEADCFSLTLIVKLYEELFGEPARGIYDVGQMFGLDMQRLNTLL